MRINNDFSFHICKTKILFALLGYSKIKLYTANCLEHNRYSGDKFPHFSAYT